LNNVILFEIVLKGIYGIEDRKLIKMVKAIAREKMQ